MKKSIRDFDLRSKKVIIRVDFNVPMQDGIITDDHRIISSIPTIEYALNEGAKVILLSHLGRVKTENDKKIYSLEPVAKKLSELLNQEVVFVSTTRGSTVEDKVKEMQDGDVILLENTRFEDIDGKKESSNVPELGSYWASLGDVFINDAFGTAHRAHASNVGIASNIPSGVGFLIEKELDVLGSALENPKRPLVVILGGSKVSDKIGVIENLVKVADYILIGGGMAYTFLYASDISIGSSLLDKEHVSFCKDILAKHSDKIVLPIDTVCAEEITDNATTRTCFINEIRENEIGVDIGYNTVKLFSQYLNEASTIIWNGPVGIFEKEPFSNGTKGICEILKNSDSIKIIGGGDTGAAVTTFGYENDVTHISTGGGASLELLEGKTLPGIGIIDEK